MRHTPKLTDLLAALLIFSQSVSSARAADFLTLDARQMRSLGIQTKVLQSAGEVRLQGLPGRIEIPAGQLQAIVAPLDGTLVEVLPAPGDSVRKGQVVARLISPQALELQRLHAEASARAAQAGAARNRDEQLFKEGIIAQARLEGSRAAAAEASAQLAQSSQTLKLAGGGTGAGGAMLELRAGLDGVLLEQLSSVGERLSAGTPIARIGRPAPLWITLQLPMRMATRVKVGDPVHLPLLGVQGKVLAVSRSVDPVSQNVTLRAQLERGVEQLRPGMAVEAEIQIGGQAGMVLPSHALVRHDGQLLAFVQQPAGEQIRFVARPVKVLSLLGDSAMVEGVSAGERVAVQGVVSLKAMLLAAPGSE